MRFTDKRKRNWIQKEDRVLDRVQPLAWVGYGGTGRYISNRNFDVFHGMY